MRNPSRPAPRSVSFGKLSALLLLLSALYGMLPYLPFRPFCLFKKLTGLPCPGCGFTRAMECLMQGDWYRSWQMNPLLLLLLLYVSVVYLLALYDWIMKTGLSWKVTHFPVGKWGYFLLTLLMLALWLRNIACGL